MYTDRPISGETVDTGVDTTLSAPAWSTIPPSAAGHPAVAGGARPTPPTSPPAGSIAGSTAAAADTGRGYLDPASTTERLRLLWSTGARDVTLVAPGDGEGHRQPGAIDPRGWIA